MINKAKRLAVFAAITIFVAAGFTTFQKSFALTNNGNITTLGTPLTENFDTLLASGSATWTNNSTIPGWYHARTGTGTTIVADVGSNTAGNLYSYGSTGSTDRALGSIGSGNAAAGSFFWGARLTNSTGSMITSLAVSYTGEQWRYSGTAAAQTVAFSYRIGNGLGNALADFNSGGTAVPQLDFTSPVISGVAGALNGNLPANRVAISFTITGLSISNGQEILLRWSDPDHGGSDHGLAIDDLSVIAAGVGDSAPSVSATSPLNNATNVPVNSNITVTFSEDVTAPAGAFSLSCGSPQTFTVSASPATTFTIDPDSDLPASTLCTVNVIGAQVSDTDPNDPPDHAADFSFSFTTAAPETAPIVTTTNPVNGAVDVPVGSNIVINFSEQVTATTNAFVIQCGATNVVFGQTSGANTSFTLDPNVNLPSNTLCTVTVNRNEISDTDPNDPPDHLAADYVFSFTTQEVVNTNIVINESDADTPGSPQDTAEFVELYDGGVGHTSLNGLTVVFYDGGTSAAPVNQVYAQFDLTGFQTDANGYFVLGNPGVPGAQITFGPGPFGTLQNGIDAVALYVGHAASFPNGTPITSANLVDAVVYHTDDTVLTGLLPLLNSSQLAVNEAGGNDAPNQSISRCENGTGGQRNTDSYLTTVPTPGAVNNCPQPNPPSTTVVISQIYGGGSNSGATYQNDYVELYNLSANRVDLTGWSLQYASAAGRGWDFNKTPLGGFIDPGHYYLIKLAAGDPLVGAPLPLEPNVSGPINMAGSNNSSGKIALVSSYDALIGECPLSNPHLVDLVGYGSAATCGEGKTKAPSLNSTRADYRINGGSTDTNNNAADFTFGAPLPRRTEPIIEIGPAVLSSDPSNNDFDIPRDPTIAVSFTEAVTIDPVGIWFTLTCSVTGEHNDSFTFVNDGAFVDITPNVNLLAGETCTFTLFHDHVHDTDTDDSAPNTDTILQDYVATFTVASGTAPPFPPSIHTTFGNPTNAGASDPDNYLMAKPEYSLSYNRALGRPNWVSWHLSSEWYGTLFRVDTFRADPQVPPDWYRVQGFDFSGTGFDRGHMVPNADRDKETSKPINQATYLMTNMVAQAPGNNQGPWAALEASLRLVADANNELFIVAGPAGEGGVPMNGNLTPTIANGHVSVPADTWKVALVLPKAGGDPISRVSCDTTSLAVIMPNIDSIRQDDWHLYLTTIDAVEALTGFDFFSNLSSQMQYCIEAREPGESPLPLDTTPPVVTCAPADGSWHNDNVDLACTTFDGNGNVSSGLVHPEDASFTLFTSVADGVETANAGTNSHQVCDNAGNCTTAGPIAGNMIDRKAPVVTCAAADGVWHNSNVAIGCTASDIALANAADASFSLVTSVAAGTADANASTDSRVVCDLAGNCSTAGPVGANKVDLAAPAITLTQPADGAFYHVSYVVNSSFSCADTGAGLATCTGTVASGAPIDTSTLGAKSFTVNATDAAGNSSIVTVTYNVVAKLPASIFINNIPGAAVNGGSFTPTVIYTGDGTTHVDSLTQSVCKVTGGVVKFVSAGTCTLQARGTPSGVYDWANGPLQSFTVAP